MLIDPQHACWICRKFVFPEDSKPDAFGFPVHKACSKRLTKEEPKSGEHQMRGNIELAKETLREIAKKRKARQGRIQNMLKTIQ